MPDLAFGTSAYSRDRGDLPELPVVNLFVESATTEPVQVVLHSRPGLVATGTTLGLGPIRALYRKGGVLSGALLAVSGNRLYVGTTNAGTFHGTLVPSIAGNEMGAVVAAGSVSVFWDGSAFSTIDFPDSASVRKVFEQGGRFIFLRNSGQAFYWTAPLDDMLDGDGEIIVDGLDFASAESEPDHLVDGLALQDILILAGTETIEFWSKTGDLELPYTPIPGRTFQKGVRETGCMALFDNSFAWVSPDNIVYRGGNVPERISDHGIEERIKASTTCRVDAFFFEGHEFLKIALDEATVLFDAATGQWCEWASHGESAFIGGAVAGDTFGSLGDGKLLRFGTAHTDLGGVLERRFRAGVALDGGAVKVANIRLRVNQGQTPFLTGDYAEPVVELRISRDKGETWSHWRQASLGAQGHYRQQTEWRALGLADAPGLLVEFRVTAPVPFAPSRVLMNEPSGGRAR